MIFLHCAFMAFWGGNHFMFLDFCVYFNELLVVVMTELYGLQYFVSKQLK